MKKFISLFFFTLAFLVLGHAQKSINVKNTSAYQRTELITIPYSDFTAHFSTDSTFTVKDGDGNIFPHQLEKLGDRVPQNVLIQVEIMPKSTLELVVSNDAAPLLPSKTYARYVPERFDDFAWENDLVAFRVYGKALEGRADDAQGMDYWAKRTPNLVINKWYKEDDYHKDHGEGLDYYSVGQTLGAGDIALYYGKEVRYTKHYREFEILDNGPLRTTFRLKFHSEEIDGNRVSLSKTISLDAGSQFNKITIELDNQDAQTTPVVVGIAKRKETAPDFFVGDKNNTLAYWEPEVNNHGKTGIALILPPKGKTEFIPDRKEQFLLATTVQNNKAYTYYNGATWDRAGRTTTSQQWFDETKRKADSIKKPLKVFLK